MPCVVFNQALYATRSAYKHHLVRMPCVVFKQGVYAIKVYTGPSTDTKRHCHLRVALALMYQVKALCTCCDACTDST